MDENKREEYAQYVTERLEATIRKEAPVGIGAWPKTRDLVHDANMDFQRACAAFVITGSDADKERMIAAGKTLREAWQGAARAFESTGV